MTPSENGYPPARPDALRLPDLLRILRRQRIWIISLTSAALVLTVLYTFLQPPVYRAQTTLRIEEAQLSAVPVLDILSELVRGAEVETEVEIIRSRRVAEGVVAELGLQARISGPRRMTRESLFEILRVDSSAVGGRYRLELGPREFELIGTEGRAVALLGQSVELGPVRLQMRAGVPEEGIEAVELTVLRFAEAVLELQEQLSVVRPRREASIIAVSYESTDPTLARDVVNSASRHFLAFRNEMQKQRASAAVRFLRNQVSSLEAQLADAESALEQFRQENLLVQVEEQVSEDVRRLAELQARRSELAVERGTLKQLLGDLPAGAEKRPTWAELASFPTFLKNEAIGNILQQLTQLETELSRLRVRRTPEDPDVRNLVSTIALVESRLAALAQSYLRALDEEAASLDRMLAAFDSQLQRVPAVEVQYARLRRNTDVLGELYTFLQTKLKESEVAEAVEAANIQIVDPAITPVEPVKPKKLVNLVLGLLLGGGLAFGIAFARDSLDTRLRSRDDVSEVSGLPVLATVPRISTGDGRRTERAARIEARLVTHHNPRSPAAEAYRALRTNLTFSAVGRGSPIRKLVFTSAEPQDGKSTTAANAAITLAEQGHRTLLLECDLRRPVLYRVFDVEKRPGLTDVIVGRLTLSDVAQRVLLPDYVEGILDLVVAGASPPNPSELLGSTAMQDFLAETVEHYDIVVLDTPPLGVVTDAAVVGALSDGVIIVTRYGATHREALRLACEQLKGVNAHLVGTVLNDLSVAQDGYGYRYSYRHYYGGDTEDA